MTDTQNHEAERPHFEALTGFGPELAQAFAAPSQIIHGSAIEQMRTLVEEYQRPVPIIITDPLTGTQAAGMVSANGVQAIDDAIFDAYLERPRHRSGTAGFTRIESLIAHVNRFKDADSALFANDSRTDPSITAVLDYNEAGPISDGSQRFGHHRSHYAFPLSNEWKVWVVSNGKKMDMRSFAEFVEANILDVIQVIPEQDELPEDLQKFIHACGGDAAIASPAKLVELSRGLQVNEKSVVKSALNLSSGESELTFQSEHVDAYGGKLRIPGLFILAIPVFHGDARYRIAARLRYRKSGEGITFWYDLYRHDLVFDHAFEAGCARAQQETALPLFFGRPE